MCQVNLKCAFKSSAALYHLASAVGFKKEAEGREEGVLCMRYYPTCCHSDMWGGVRSRKACREIGEDEEGVGWLVGVARCFLKSFIERLS